MFFVEALLECRKIVEPCKLFVAITDTVFIMLDLIHPTGVFIWTCNDDVDFLQDLLVLMLITRQVWQMISITSVR